MHDKSVSVLHLLSALAAIHQYGQVSEIPVRVLMFQPASWVVRPLSMIFSHLFMPRGVLGISLVIHPILYTPLWVDFCKRSIGSNELFAQGIPFPAWEVPHCSRWQIGLSGTGKQPQLVRFELSSVCVLELRSCLFFGRTWQGMQPAFLQQWHPTAPCFSLSWQLLRSCRYPRSGSLGCCPASVVSTVLLDEFSGSFEFSRLMLLFALMTCWSMPFANPSRCSLVCVEQIVCSYPSTFQPHWCRADLFLWFFTVFISTDLSLWRNSMPTQASISSDWMITIYFDIVMKIFPF